MAEVRPFFGALVSLALFEMQSEATVVDCSRYHAERPFSRLLDVPLDKQDEILSPETIEKAVWIDIDRAFSELLRAGDDTADYTPTQVLAELFKSEGHAGVVYKSRLTENGFNLALFDPEIAIQVYGKLHSVEVHIKSIDPFEDEYFIGKDGTCTRIEITDIQPVPPDGVRRSPAQTREQTASDGNQER